VNAWYVFGSILAGWALLVSFIGITREKFPASRGATLIVGAISILLAVLAIGAAVYSGIHEEEEEGEAAVLRSTTGTPSTTRSSSEGCPCTTRTK
jgi:hypothetical protein